MFNIKSFDENDGRATPPKQNNSALIPTTRLVHNLNNARDLGDCVVIDMNVVKLIHQKLPSNIGQISKRFSMDLDLLGYNSQFKVTIWLIPIFSDGVLVHLLFAADELNQLLLQKHRNPVKPSDDYDILSL